MDTKPGGKGEGVCGGVGVQKHGTGQGLAAAGRTGLLLVGSSKAASPPWLQQALQFVFQQPHSSPGRTLPCTVLMPLLPTFFSQHFLEMEGILPVCGASDIKVTADLGVEHMTPRARLPRLTSELCAPSPGGVAKTQPLFTDAK